jgi:hypothetical protein
MVRQPGREGISMDEMVLARVRLVEELFAAHLRAGKTAVCPECGGPANPLVVDRFGECVPCRNAKLGL